MKIDRTATHYSGTGEIRTRKFTIEDTVMIANMLSNMYSDPVLAVIREYICNALDSHKAAGKPEVPVTVIVPNLLENTFTIRDYGLGMSDDEVMKLFSTYGASSKRETNEMVGGFGIGSKSGFAYTDNFTVESIFNGEKLTYIVFMCESNGPSIELISRNPTSENNGFSVKIPVKKQDINTFKEKLIKFLKFVDNPVEVQGCDFEKPKLLKSLDHLGWTAKFYSSSEWRDGGSVYIKMGPVIYSASDIFNHWESSFKTPIVIECPIGTFNISPDRESVIIKPETKQEIRDWCNALVPILQKEILEELQQEPTLYRAQLKYVNCTSDILKYLKFSWKRYKENSYNKYCKCVRFIHYYNQPFNTDDKFSTRYRNNLIAFVDMEGKKTNHLKVVKNYCSYDKDFFEKFKSNDSRIVILPNDMMKRKRLFIALGRPDVPIIKYSDWISFGKVDSVSQRKPVQFKVFKREPIRVSIREQLVAVDDNYPVKFIPIVNNQIELECGVNFSIQLIHSIDKLLGMCGVKDEEIVFVPKTLSNKIPDYWINLKPHIDNTISELQTLPIVEENIDRPTDLKYVTNKWLEVIDIFRKNHLSFRDIYQDFGIEIPNELRFQHVFPKINNHNRFSSLLQKINEDFKSTYPMVHGLAYLGYPYNKVKPKIVQDYVNAMNMYKMSLDKNYKPRYMTIITP